MSADLKDLIVTDVKSELTEEELLGLSDCSENDDDVLSIGTSDMGDLLDSDTLFDVSERPSQTQPKPVLKPSQINRITAPKQPMPEPQNVSNPSSSPTSRIHSKKKISIKTVASKTKILGSTRVTVGVLSQKKQTYPLEQRKSPAGAQYVKVKPSVRCPIKPPSEASVRTTCSSSSLLQGGNYCEDFIFPSSPQLDHVTDSDDLASSRDTEDSRDYSNNSDIEASLLSHKAKVLDSSKNASSTMTDDDSTCVVAPWGPTAQHVFHNSGLSTTCTTTKKSLACNPFRPLPETNVHVKTSPREVTYSKSTVSPDALGTQEEQMKKCTIIKLNKAKVFRYVPEELPEVKLPILASKKWPTRKRANTFPGDDCPNLLFETKRHAGENDLRSKLTAQRINKLSTIDEVSSTSDPPEKITSVITSDDTSSSMTLSSDRDLLSRPKSPIASTASRIGGESARVIPRIFSEGTFSFSPNRLVDSCRKSPLSSPSKWTDTVTPESLNWRTERACGCGKSDEVLIRTMQFSVTDKHAHPIKTTSEPVKKTVVATHTSSQQQQTPLKCVSIFAQRPNLMSRSSIALNRFSLHHLDQPDSRPFALDHL